MQAIIECQNLTHYYGTRCIYTNLNFTVPKGRILGLLGKNGTGKTTTINILNGFLQPKEGNCLIFGEPSGKLSPEVKQKIALLLEGHVQYSFMNINQIEKFYSAFYPKWNKTPFYELMRKLKIAPNQKIANMSCGQRSQVALGLILAQDADLLVLDDFSMGLDPGYRRLFIDYLNEYIRSEGKTVLVTSHIIQDMERFIDDCLILDYGKILIQIPVDELLKTFRKFQFTHNENHIDWNGLDIYNPEITRNHAEFHAFSNSIDIKSLLLQSGIQFTNLTETQLTLEDAFIGLTGKY
ncbi:MAG: ABC transporter ATP-binding protein [Bacteroidales bacterium]|nr:ABC transporter ATP-binding protein [Bacteroidales bacterium]